VSVIEQQAREAREATGLPLLGVKAILAQKPQDRPSRPKKSPAPLFHAFTKSMRKALWEAYGWFVAAFREAAEKLRAGDRMANFPTGSSRLIFPSSPADRPDRARRNPRSTRPPVKSQQRSESHYRFSSLREGE